MIGPQLVRAEVTPMRKRGLVKFDLSRQIEFLYSRNRLNVAISRARCVAVIVAAPRLLETSCSTIDQMRLVNALCWAKNFADGHC
jgi:uncharacterized protein